MLKCCLSAFVVLVLIFVGCGSSEKTEETAQIELSSANIILEGIKCQMCVAYVQKAASSVEGVEHMVIDFDGKFATVKYNPENTTLTSIERAIADAGYTANETIRDEIAYKALPDC